MCIKSYLQWLQANLPINGANNLASLKRKTKQNTPVKYMTIRWSANYWGKGSLSLPLILSGKFWIHKT